MKIRVPFLRRPKKPDPPEPRRSLRFAEIEDIRRRRLKVIKLIGILVVLIAAIALGVYLFSFTLVKHVSCKLGGEKCENLLEQSADTLQGKSMLASLSLSHPYLKVAVKRVWPNGVEVSFSKPELLLSFQPSKAGVKSFSLTDSGFVVYFLADGSSFPPITDAALEAMPEGARVPEPTLNFYRELTLALHKVPSLPIQTIKVVDASDVEIALNQNTRAIAMQKGITQELSSLQAILLSPTINREGKVIDLRFENPVLK